MTEPTYPPGPAPLGRMLDRTDSQCAYQPDHTDNSGRCPNPATTHLLVPNDAVAKAEQRPYTVAACATHAPRARTVPSLDEHPVSAECFTGRSSWQTRHPLAGIPSTCLNPTEPTPALAAAAELIAENA